MGWGKGGKGWHGGKSWHHHHGPGPLGGAVIAAEAAMVGAVAGAAVATAVTRPKAKPKPRAYHPPVVVVVDATPAPVPAVAVVESSPAPAVVVAAKGVPKPKNWDWHWKGDGKGWGWHWIDQGKGKGKGKWKGHVDAVVVQAPPPKPLCITGISMPAEICDDRDGTHFFGINVFPESGCSWRVMRRYNDFSNLHGQLGSTADSLPGAPFPGKSGMFGCTGERLDERRRGLEIWLQRVVEHPSSKCMWTNALREFLEGGRVFLSATAPAAAPAPVPLPSAPPPVDNPAGSFDSAGSGQVLSIQVPAGVTAGQVLGVTVPDGCQVNVILPEGVSEHLDLWFDPSAGTLTPML